MCQLPRLMHLACRDRQVRTALLLWRPLFCVWYQWPRCLAQSMCYESVCEAPGNLLRHLRRLSEMLGWLQRAAFR